MNDERYDIVHALLALAYLILAMICLHNIVKSCTKRKMAIMHSHNRSANHTFQSLFYPTFMAGAIIRTIFFVLQPLVMESVIKFENALNYFLNTVPTFFFFAAYLIILFRWAEIYHNSYELSTIKVRHLHKVLLWLIIVMFTVVGSLYVVDLVVYPGEDADVSKIGNIIEVIIMWFGISLYLGTSMGFIFYGVGLYRRLSAMPKFTNALIDYCLKIQRLTTVVCLVFVVRGAILTITVLKYRSISQHWWFDGAYFFGLEIIPLVLMLYILKLRKKR
jgi:hypothetical protein